MATALPAETSAIIRVYGDLSGHEHDQFMAGAVYLGKSREFDAAAVEWQRILDEMSAIDGRPGKPFHATDFFSGKKDFRGWDPRSDQVKAFALRFASVASNAGLIGFSFAVDNLAFGQILAPVLAEEQREYSAKDLRTFCAMQAINLVSAYLHVAMNGNPPGALRGNGLITLEQEQDCDRYSRFFAEARARKERWTWWYREIDFGDKTVAALQLADLLAYLSWHRAQDVARDAAASLNPVFARMLEGGKVEMKWLREETASANADLFRQILRSHPRGLVSDAELGRIRDRPSAWRRLRLKAAALIRRGRSLFKKAR